MKQRSVVVDRLCQMQSLEQQGEVTNVLLRAGPPSVTECGSGRRLLPCEIPRQQKTPPLPGSVK